MAQPKAPHPIIVAPDEKLTPEKKAKLAEWNAYNNPNGPGGQPQPTGAPWGYNPDGVPLGPNGGMLVNRGLAFPGAGFFNDPSNIAQTYETYKDDAGNVPDWLDWGGVEAAYRYMQATQGQDSSKWMWLNPQDPANSFLSGLGAPPTGTIKPYEPIPTEPAGADWTSAGYKEDGTFDIGAIPVEQRSQVYNTPGFDITQYDPATREAMLGDPAFPWENLPDWQKTYYSIISNPKIMASPLALAGAKAGGIAGPIGNVIGGIGGYLLGIVGGKEYDPTGDFEDQPSVAAKGMYLLNRLSEASEQAVGYTAQLSDAALAGLQGNEQAAEAAKKMVFDKQYRSAAWEAGRMVYEYADTPLKNLAPIMFSFAQVFNKKNWDKKIGLPELAGPGEDFVLGQAEPVKRGAEMGTNPLTGETRLVTDSMGMLQEARLAILEAYEQGASADDVRGVIREMMGEASQFVGSQVQDLAFQTIFDPLNVVDDYSGKAAGAVIEGVAKVNPELAARLTANPELMATMLRTGKGVIEPMTRRWGELVRSGAVGMVDDLTAFDRLAGGLDAEGRVKGLSPDKPTNFLQYLTTMTPESKARTAVYTMSDNLKAMLLDASPDDFLRAFNVAATGDLKAARDMGAAFLGSPESYTFLPILKDFQQRAGGLLDLWKQGDVNGNRSALLKVGQILGENPGEVLKRFLDGDAQPDFERLVDAARRSDDPAAREFVAEVEAGRITAEGLVNDFGIFKQVPYHPDEWKAMVYDAFMEHVAERVTDIYKLEPDSKFFQSIKTLKGVQSLLLLSLSPSYLINNVMNNAATMAADGLFGFVPPWKVDEWMNKFGLEPTRLKQGIGAIGDTSKVETGYGKTVEGIFKRPDAKTPEDILGDTSKATGVNASVQRVIGSVNRKVGIFASLSGKMEAVQSKQAFSTAMRKFWGNVWNRGKGFDTMPAALEGGLRQAGVDPNTIYTAIESGMNWKDVEGMLRGSEKLGARYQVSNYINRAAESLGMTPADARNLLGAAGVLDELESTIARAKDSSQIASAFAAVERKSQRWIDTVSARELRGMAEANAQRVQTEGYAGAHDIFVEQFQRLEKRWVDNYVEWEAAHAMAQAATDQASKSAIYRAQRERSISNWRRYFEYEAATWKGISDAFGMTDEKGRKFLAGIADYQKENQTFFREYADAVNEHFNKIFDTREQAIADWNALVDEYDAKWKDVTINKNKVWMDLDEQLAGWFEDKYGTQAGADARKWLKNKADFHDEMTLTMRQFRDSTKYLPAEPKRAAWMKFVAEEYVPMIKTFTDIAHGGAADTYASITGRPKGPGPAAELFTAENTTRVQEINQVAEAHAASVWEVAAKYGVYGLDDAGTPVKNASLNLIKTVKKWGGGEGGYIRTFQDITPTLLERALSNRAEWEKMQAEFDASVMEPAPKPVETLADVPEAVIGPTVPELPGEPIDPQTQKRATVLEGIQRRTIDTLPEPVRDGIARALKAMEDEVQAEHGDSLLAWLRKRGGLSKQYLADLTGETRIRKEWGPGVFTNRTGTQYALDTIAREAADYGYLTPDKLADDGGVGAITDLLQRELSGEKVYPVGTEALPEWYKGLRAGGDKKATALAAIDRVRTGTDAVKYGGKATATELAVKEEAFARLAGEASYDARLSELTGWPFDDNGLKDAIDGIEGRYDPNNLDALRSLETEINDQLANLPEAVDDATLTRLLELNSKVAESIDIHTMRADAEAVISNAELRADAEMNRRVHHERLIEAFGLAPEQADAQVAVLDGVSEYWAKLTGRDASEWWGEFVRDVRRGEAGEGALEQIPPEYARTMDYPTRIPDSETFRNAVENTPNAQLTDEGLLVDLVRRQKPEQEGAVSVRTGVFYLVAGDKNLKYYKQGGGSYGGTVEVRGETLIKAPIEVMGATGGKAPERAYDAVLGKGSYEAMRSDVLSGMPRGKDRAAYYDAAANTLIKYGFDEDTAYGLAEYISEYSREGNRYAYALQEAIVAREVRNAGHDAIVGMSRRKDGTYFISEVFDLRESTYPTTYGDFNVNPEFGGDSLFQLAPVTRQMTDTEVTRYAGALVRQGEDALRQAVSYEGNRADRIALLDAAHKLDPAMAEGVAKQVQSTLYQAPPPKWGEGNLPDEFSYRSTLTDVEGQTAFGITKDKKVAFSVMKDGDIKGHTKLARSVGLSDEGGFPARGYFTFFKGKDGEMHPVAVVYADSNWGNTAADRIEFFNKNYDKILRSTGFESPEQIYVSFDSGYSGLAMKNWDPDNAQTYKWFYQGAKASISFDVDSKAVITAFEAADFSSSIHEHAHIFLPMLDRMANEGFGSLAKTDLEAVRGWMAGEATRLNAERTAGNLSADQVSALFVDADGKATDTIMPFDEAGNYTRAGQELFARGFERYIADGFAPTVALGKVFAAFKDWMLKIYRSITGSGIDVNLTQDVRDVFDRLVSGDPDLNRVDLTPSASKVEVYKSGDIVRMGDGVQATVTEVRPNGDLRLDNGRVVSRVAVERVAEQENMFGDMGMQAGPDAQQTSLFQRAPAVDTPEFKRWFGDSKVVDADGKPLVVYHGTRADFTEFRPGRAGTLGPGIYFSEDSSYASMLTRVGGEEGGKVVPAYLSIQNPLIVDYRTSEGLRLLALVEGSNAYLLDNGYDGAILIDTAGNKQEVVVLRSQQAKSIFNRGTFDPADPNILYQNTPDNPVYPPGGYEEATGYYPTSRVQDEAWAEQVRPVLDAMRDAALKPENAGPDYMNIPDEAAQSFKRYMQTVKNQMTTAKRATVAYGESARDFALLPYHKQYGFDKLMQVGFPYQFFTTRTMMNWAMRAMDKPGMMATYSRLKRFQNQQESNLPERLRDKVWMAMPFLPEWAGGGTWINPNPALFPFENLLSPLKSYAQNRMYEANNATYIIQRWVDEGKVTQSAAQDALQSQTGATWERAIKAAQAEGGENPMDYFTMLYGPALYATLPYYLATGKKAGASGWPSSPLPITRTGKALETAFKGTGLEWIGDTVGGALQAPEKWGREQLGLNEFGEWGDFYVDRQLANMAAEGEYTSQEVRQAMIERTGPIYDAAVERVNIEYLSKTPGALPLYGAAHGARLDEVLGSILPSMFSGGLLPEGELELKGLKGEYNLAWESYKTGDKEALTKFFDAYPEYEARLALRDEPDERLRNFLTSEIWDRYMALGKTYRKQAGQALGDEFGEFLGNSTELTDSLPIEKLARWAQVLGGMVPKVEETAPVIEEPQTINWYNEAVQGTLDTFYSERDEKFPNYWFIQSGYFAQPQSKRAQYLMKFPELKEYWDWKDGWEQRYPDMQPYFSGEVFKNIDTTGWPEPLVYQATIYALTGTRMTSGMEAWLEQVWIGMGRPYGTLDAWMNIDVSPALRTRISGMGSQVIPQP